MTGALDNTARNVAKSLTDKFGTTATLRQEVRTIDPNTGVLLSEVQTDTTVPITPPGSRPPRNFGQMRGDFDDTVQMDRLWTSIPALGLAVVPAVGDRLLFQSETTEYQIVAVFPLSSGNLIANYTIQCKR